MKKILMMSMAAVAAAGAFTSCSHDTDYFDPNAVNQLVYDSYNQAFRLNIGDPALTQTWGFGGGAAARATRSITVNGDVYDKFPSAGDVADKFPTSIPADADEVAELPTKYKDYQYGNLYFIYKDIITEGHNLKITQTGTFELGGTYQNVESYYDASIPPYGANVTKYHYYNVYVDVDGDVTIKRNGATHFNLYILKGNVTLGADYGEQSGLISVAEGATLNDKRNSIAANGGVQLYNRGTINATDETKYDIGNFCTVYNEGTFNVKGALTYSPGDANTSYFVNKGDDAVLTAASMTLNSSGNFFNDGTATITGETNVTQAGIYWVNAGHYTTGSMVFSAKNATFYNYCQLLVKGNAHMYDGEFNLMTNSYTEAATAEFDNFIVNMESNSGFNVNGDTDWAAQGDGTYQGFQTSGSNVYVRLGGKTTVAGHKLSLELTGNITYAIKEIDDLGASNSGVQPTYRFNEGTIEAPFDKLTVTPNEEGCGATWSTGTTEPDPETPEFTFLARIFAEDLSATTGSDFDFNDVVFDVYTNGTDAKVVVLAAGGTLPLTVAGEEVHALFGQSTDVMINTDATNRTNAGTKGVDGLDPVELPNLVKDVATMSDLNNIEVRVQKSNINGELGWYKLTADPAQPASKFAVAKQIKWLKERADITKVYIGFQNWVTQNNDAEWYKQTADGTEDLYEE